jgi:hypothetical protein
MHPRNTDHATRLEIITRHLAGETLANLAEELRLNFYTVRKWGRVYHRQGWPGLIPKLAGPPSRGILSKFDPLIKYVVLRLKRQHPAWGLDVLRLELKRRPSLRGKVLPQRTAIWNYLRRFYPRLMEHRRFRTQRPHPKTSSIIAVHQRWQMDFKGDVHIPGLGQVKPFIVCDEFTGAPLAGIIHWVKGPDHPSQLSFRDIQADLRMVFSQWGLPDQLRMDRDPLWIGSSRLEWPGTLLLWLIGLGVTPVINRPYCPTDNPHVERRNRIWNEHVCIGTTCQRLDQLQALTDQAWQDRRELLPSRNPNCAGQPPLIAHPELAQPRRPYQPDQEQHLFELQRVYTYLNQWQWQRKVDCLGSISIADFTRRVSPNHLGQIVKVRFEVATYEFVAAAMDGTELRRFTLPIISSDYIMGYLINE